jgi:uncharacterized protein YbjT (DUF2867 family)
MKKAILLGASGFVGSYLLSELLNNSDYSQVTVIVRKKLDIDHPKLKTYIGDYQSLSSLGEAMAADDIFLVIGTTQKQTPDREKYYQIDHDYPVLAAKLAKEKGAKSVFVVTAVGANADSNVFYVRMKGETEKDIIALDFDHTHIFRPSMIMGDRKESRSMEKFFIKAFTLINPILTGKTLKKYRGIDGKHIAQAINNATKNQTEKVKIYHWPDMDSLL